MNNREKEKGKKFEDPKGGRKQLPKDPREPKPKEGLLVPSDNDVTAISVMELPASSTPGSIFVSYPISVLHSELYVQAFFNRALSNHSSIVRNIIKKVAANYFSQVSPTTVTQIEAQVGNAIIASMKTFALICYLWKVQNGLQFEDEDGFQLKNVLYGCYGLYGAIGEARYSNDKLQGTNLGITGDLSISNALWKKDILSRLNKIYVSDKFAEFAYTAMGHFIQFDYGDEESIRLWDVFPADLGISVNVANPTAPTYNDIVTLLDGYEALIDTAYNTYPFMEQILEMLGLKRPGDKYDFTRDLAQMKLNVLKDRDHALENLCFMVSHERDTSTELTASTNYWRVISTQIPSAAFKFYEDERECAQNLIYFDRVTTNIKSITNALRGSLRSMFISYFVRTNPANKVIYVTGPNLVRFTGIISTSTISDTDAEKLIAIADTTWVLNILDMPNDLVTVKVSTFASITSYTGIAVLYDAGGAHDAFTGGGVYVLSENDLNSVISDACAFLLFESKDIPGTMQTLGNDGKA